MTGFWRDVMYACRSLSKARAFSVVCVVTLGIGMAPVVAVHYFFRALVTPPPAIDIDRPTQLVEVFTSRVGSHAPTDRWSYPDFVDLRTADTGMSLTGWVSGGSSVTLPDSSTKTQSVALYVASNYFRTLGVALTRGPGFPETGAAEPAVVFGYDFWQRRLAADPAIVGKTVVVNGVPHVVAGIAPDGFGGPFAVQPADLFLPLERHPELLARSGARFDRSKPLVHIHGRLLPGVSVAQASAAVAAITSGLATEYPSTNEFITGVAAPYRAIGNVDGEDFNIVKTAWHVITGLLLLVVCLNVSGMMQVRSAMRERELTIRQTIGASRMRLVQHLLTESVLLAGLGGTLASLALVNLLPVVYWWMNEPIPPELKAVLRVDVSTIATTVGLCLATSLVFGLLPALRFSRPVMLTVLKDEAGSSGIRTGRAHRFAGALQIAIAVPLLILSFMSIERVRATASADLGFASDVLYAAPINSDAQFRQVRDNLARSAGVAAVTVADGIPLDFRYRLAKVSAQTDVDRAPAIAEAQVTRVGDDYLSAMQIALVAGRGFMSDDGPGAPLVTIVSKPLADGLFPNGAAVGQRLTFRTQSDGEPRTFTIVGVTAEFPTSQMNTDRKQLLLPLAQHPDLRKDSVPVSDDRQGAVMLMLIARGTAGESSTKLTAALENAIRDVDPDFDRTRIVTGESLRQRSIDDYLNAFAFAGVASGVTLLLAALGIYGVVGLMVTSRTREIAVRVALGASRPRLIAMVLFDVVKLVGPGVVVGVLLTALVARLDGGIRLSAIEPLAYAAGAAVAVLTAVLASLAPARRAAAVQPMVAMKST